MRYFNADGSEGEMCGNGARCFAKYVFDKGLVPKQMTLKTKSGLYGLTIIDDATVEITFPSYQVEEIKQIPDAAGGKIVYSVMVGVPHAVFFADAINKIATFEYENFARKIRYNKGLFPNGTNVNMVERISANRIYVRTYERGVERDVRLRHRRDRIIDHRGFLEICTASGARHDERGRACRIIP